MLWTVIGLYDETGGTYADTFEAESAYAAMRMAADKADGSADLAILGAISGSVELIAACEDSGNCAYACDLCSDEDEICGCGRNPSECTQGECDCGGCHDNDEDCDAMQKRLKLDKED